MLLNDAAVVLISRHKLSLQQSCWGPMEATDCTGLYTVLLLTLALKIIQVQIPTVEGGATLIQLETIGDSSLFTAGQVWCLCLTWLACDGGRLSIIFNVVALNKLNL